MKKLKLMRKSGSEVCPAAGPGTMEEADEV
jgi:hypothetical protein